MMRFVVRKRFKWAGKTYEPGMRIEIPDGHLRIPAMIRGHHIIYDSASLTESQVKELMPAGSHVSDRADIADIIARKP